MAVDVESPNKSTASETYKPHHTINAFDGGGEEEVNDTPIEQVRLTVSPTDNPNLPVLTFRAWFLGIMACALLAFLNQFFGYRENGLAVSAVAAQIVTLPLGKLMAATLPTNQFSVPFLNWKFSLNPGPFNVKEHVLITIFANSGSNGAYALSIVTIMKAFYHRGMNPVAAFLLVQTTMLLGYGWAGMYRKILVDSPYMWWPGNMINISLFRTLHDDEKRQKGGLTRLQFFLLAFSASFAYYVFPAYFIPSISTISIGCFIWKKSVLAQQLSSGLHGLGIGAFSLDWNAVVSFLGNPLGIPSFAIINTMVGFIVVLYIIIPAVHWTNTYDAKKFPLISSHVFDSTGQRYNTTLVLNQKSFDLNAPAYDSYSKLYLSTTFAMNYGFSFATLTAAISHVILFYGRSIMRHWSQTTALRDKDGDVHTRLMKKNYEPVPNWWFHSILAVVFALSLLTCEGFGKQIQLPWWGLVLACAIAFFFTLPIGIIQAITNQGIGLNVITELVIGYLYPGKPLANVTFKTYGYISMTQALYFLGDFKLGHYMKIPPKSMFIVQLAGTLVACSVQFATAWWLLTSVNNICTPSLLPKGSPWTCPGDDVFYNASIIWGVIGPKRMFTRLGVYPELNWFFLIGLLAPVPVWFFSRKYPEKHWIKLINMPLVFGATSNMPPARAVNYWMWGGVGLFFSHYVYKQHKQWWAKHAYILGAALDAGIAFMAILLYVTLQGRGIFGPSWWGLDNDDHCPLASCPTAPGILVEGCPVF